ncbi:MAG TPA: hypothetical protein VF189_03340 [Patescibacteria group bacterium]
MLKNKLYLIVAALIILLLVGGGIFFVMSSKKQAAPVGQDINAQILTLSPKDVGLDVAFRDDNKALKFTLNNASDITAAEYQLSYTKTVDGENVSEGLIGEVDITPGAKTAGIGYREFGTCSSGVCRYDTVTSAIDLTIKITKTDGKIYQVEQKVDLPTK